MIWMWKSVHNQTDVVQINALWCTKLMGINLAAEITIRFLLVSHSMQFDSSIIFYLLFFFIWFGILTKLQFGQWQNSFQQLRCTTMRWHNSKWKECCIDICLAYWLYISSTDLFWHLQVGILIFILFLTPSCGHFITFVLNWVSMNFKK